MPSALKDGSLQSATSLAYVHAEPVKLHEFLDVARFSLVTRGCGRATPSPFFLAAWRLCGWRRCGCPRWPAAVCRPCRGASGWVMRSRGSAHVSYRPFTQRWPRLTGESGSPQTFTMRVFLGEHLEAQAERAFGAGRQHRLATRERAAKAAGLVEERAGSGSLATHAPQEVQVFRTRRISSACPRPPGCGCRDRRPSSVCTPSISSQVRTQRPQRMQRVVINPEILRREVHRHGRDRDTGTGHC